MENKLDNHYKKIYKTLPPENIKAIKDYTGTGSVLLTNHLLGKIKLPSHRIQYAEYLEECLRESISLSQTPFPLTVYHGMSSNLIKVEEQLKYKGNNLKKDDIVTFDTFISTSIDKEVSKRFMKDKTGEKGLMLEINIDANYPALWVKPLSFQKQEKELLLLDKTQLVVEEIRKESTLNNQYYVKVKAI